MRPRRGLARISQGRTEHTERTGSAGNRNETEKSSAYSHFDRLDGSHPYASAVPDSHVKYSVRTRHGGEVFYFNFALAREMGLIGEDHPDEMTSGLAKKIVDTFGIVIINEYDIQNNRSFKKEDIRPKKYMATRYLQLQHPNKRGKTSGDGRGIWNGCVTHRGVTWDVSSSGTGATRLSPACAIEKKFFKTGDKRVCYGNGYADLDDGLGAAMLSEIFHHNGIPTERTLALISYRGGASINVRASRNLLRPAHFFRYLKLSHYEGLKASVDFFISRQINNGDWQSPRGGANHYKAFAEYMAETFAEMVALFQSHYIFCWLDWDGDNILANGGIIDYGSVRQFGLYHHQYCYDDGDRYSTKIPEQKAKARYIVQTFAQICDYLHTGTKKKIEVFKDSPVLKTFDLKFERVVREELLRKVGFSRKQARELVQESLKPRSKVRDAILSFEKIFSKFERATSARGVYSLPDGLTSDAIFCMRDLLREMPRRLSQSPRGLSTGEFVEIAKSSYARKYDLKQALTQHFAVARFQKTYLRLIEEASVLFRNSNRKRMLLEVGMRASIVNQADRITGNGVIFVTEKLLRAKSKMTPVAVYRIVGGLVNHQTRTETFRARLSQPAPRGQVKVLLEKTIEIISESAESI